MGGTIICNWSRWNRAIVLYLILQVQATLRTGGWPVPDLVDRRPREQPLVARVGEFTIEQQAEPFGDKVSGENGLALNYQPVFARIAA